jgi:hypothetical protein
MNNRFSGNLGLPIFITTMGGIVTEERWLIFSNPLCSRTSGGSAHAISSILSGEGFDEIS